MQIPFGKKEEFCIFACLLRCKVFSRAHAFHFNEIGNLLKNLMIFGRNLNEEHTIGFYSINRIFNFFWKISDTFSGGWITKIYTLIYGFPQKIITKKATNENCNNVMEYTNNGSHHKRSTPKPRHTNSPDNVNLAWKKGICRASVCV